MFRSICREPRRASIAACHFGPPKTTASNVTSRVRVSPSLRMSLSLSENFPLGHLASVPLTLAVGTNLQASCQTLKSSGTPAGTFLISKEPSALVTAKIGLSRESVLADIQG